MEKTNNTAALRSIAPHWTLAGDKQLLNVLQDIHQKIMTRCQETNTKLEEMATALDGANIDLQNVNNKFMALSNRQFVESRVYDDDLDETAEITPIKQETTKPSSQPQPELELVKLKQSLKILESMHESVRILASDSDSDTDEDDGRMVYKPIDLYAQRPLPHIIGTQAWKRKWHAGIIPEDSDSDSSTSKPGKALAEQYSDSEAEATDTGTDRLHPPPRTISSSSSVADSEPSTPAAPLSQAHIAAELARKLGGNLPELPSRSPEPEFTKPEAASKIYKPSKPATSTIFLDEPPPLDQTYQSDGDDFKEDEDDDIFAELRKNKPSLNTNKDQKRLSDDLFGGLNTSQDVVDDIFGIEKIDSNLFSNNEKHVEVTKEIEKKPVGGISLFGSSKGTESIGAAILKRNERKTYSSDEESEKEIFRTKQETKREIQKESIKAEANPKPSKSNWNKSEYSKDNVIYQSNEKKIQSKTAESPEKDILQNIFEKNIPSKSKNLNTSINQDSNSKHKNIDLFSDDLFDDIDNIFTDNIVKVPVNEANKNVKSIFDDVDDDLFADIAVTNRTETNTKKSDYKPKGLFDSDNDDDLFSDTPSKPSDKLQQPPVIESENRVTANNVISVNNKETKNIFDDDDDDDIFSNLKNSSATHNNKVDFDATKEVEDQSQSQSRIDITGKDKVDKDDDNNNLFVDNCIILSKTATEQIESTITVSIKPEQIIDKDNSEKFINSSQDIQNVSPHYRSSNQTSELSPALFGEEENDDFFSKKEEIINNRDFSYTDLKHEKEIVPNDTIKNLKTLHTKSGSLDSNVSVSSNNILFNSGKMETVIKELTRPEPESVKEVAPSLFNKSHLENCDNQESQIDNKLLNNKDSLLNNMESSTLPPDQNQVLAQEPDIFSDIFIDVPPAFEKPTEPKRSKNVNALFDDDSDDESLFFKKDNIVSDEKPNLTLKSDAKVDSLFSIFSDEPPAIDIVSTQNTTKNIKSETEQYKENDSINSSHSFSQPITNIIKNDIMRSSVRHKEQEIDKDSADKLNNMDNKTSVGKLKAVDFNINVNTLLPGASPKKTKTNKETEDQIVSTVNIDAHTNPENIESKLVKSVSFEGEADSELLDNKFSKERAKIQVKRRPSTRRARQEAVKKSSIDFESNKSRDLEDNSSSLEGSKTKIMDQVLEGTGKETALATNKEQDVKSKIVYILNDEDIFTNVKTDEPARQNSKIPTTNIKENSKNNDPLEYENDDIFSNYSISKETVIGKVEVSDEINRNKVDNIPQQQRKVDKENKNSSIKAETNNQSFIKTKASIFDDMSDEEAELFFNKKPTALKTKNIFESDSDEELFAGISKKTVEKVDKKPKKLSFKVEAKKSLFDDDSDDDLFGAKTNSSGNNQVFSKPKEVKPTQTQMVAEDPLSLFTAED